MNGTTRGGRDGMDVVDDTNINTPKSVVGVNADATTARDPGIDANELPSEVGRQYRRTSKLPGEGTAGKKRKGTGRSGAAPSVRIKEIPLKAAAAVQRVVRDNEIIRSAAPKRRRTRSDAGAARPRKAARKDTGGRFWNPGKDSDDYTSSFGVVASTLAGAAKPMVFSALPIIGLYAFKVFLEGWMVAQSDERNYDHNGDPHVNLLL